MGHQSGETGEGAAIGAATGAAIGGAMGAAEDREERSVGDYEDVDFGELMTDSEKERVLARSDEEVIINWSDYLTKAEKERLLRRSGRAIGDS